MRLQGSRIRSRQWLLAVVVACTVCHAQADDESLEEVVVTGSRIARPDFTSASPIVSVDATRFEQSSAITVEGVLDTLPQFVPAFGSTSNNPANGGQGNLSLRGLPTTATLVLIDGRRVIPANGTGVVDVNLIPPMLIESVEVITGGASAVYGSDALAGVVNFKLRRDFDGVEFDAMGGVTGQGDADEYAFGLAAGTDFADGRGSLMGFAGYTHRNQVNYSARSFSRYALEYLPPEQGEGLTGPNRQFIYAGSPTIEEGRAQVNPSRAAFNSLFASYGYPSGSVPFQGQLGFNTDGTLFTLGLLPVATSGAVANFRGQRDPVTYNDIVYRYNFAPENALQLPLERYSFFGRADYELGESATLFADLLYADYKVTTQLAATPVLNILIPVTNPYISADLATLLNSRANRNAPFRFSKRMSELGPRRSENVYDALQGTLGLRGDLAGGWTYEVYAQAGWNHQDETQQNNALTSRLEELTFAADGGKALCGGFNPFGLGSISAECAAYVVADGTNKTDVSQYVAEASVNGPIVELPAGAIKGVAGVFFKRDDFSYKADPIASKVLPDGRFDIQGFNASDDVDGYDYNTDLYVEVLVPLASGQPWARSLDAVLGYRWSDYASVGGVNSYKGELLYRPVDAYLLRGSYQHAVRAPSVYELYQPQLGPTVFIDGSKGDPCNFDGPYRAGADAAAVESLCLAQGLPAALLSTYSNPDPEVDGISGGNPDLDVETADTYTAGVVIEPRFEATWLQKLQVSVDWYDISIDGAIAFVDASDAVDRCYDSKFNRTLAVTNEYCTYFARDLETGVIVDATTILRNTAGYRTQGIDVQLDWGMPAGPGDVALNWLVGYVLSFEELQASGVDPVEADGTIGAAVGGSLPEWKWNLRASYLWNDFDFVLQWRYVDSLQDAEFPEFTIEAQNYLDIVIGYDFASGTLSGLTLRAGIENLTDAEPPIFPSYVQANTDPSQYDVLGRRYFMRLNYRL
jgi:outer membrane receptor protein involved in Fe transport